MRYITRLAPAPTGHLHLGHVYHALQVMKKASQYNARVLQRIEDHDSIRSRQEFADSIIDDMHFLGFADPAQWTYQSGRMERYSQIFLGLAEEGLLYKCTCSRSLIKDRSGSVYDGHCRKNLLRPEEAENIINIIYKYNTGLKRTERPAPLDFQIRLKTVNREITFTDQIHGSVSGNPYYDPGDFTVLDRHLNFTYQLCVTADDHDSGVNLIVRGEDLLDSVPRQIYLRELILQTDASYSSVCRTHVTANVRYGSGSMHPQEILWFHHNLILDSDGKKLSKRYRSYTVRDLRTQGLSREEILALSAAAAGELHPGRIT